MLQGTRDWRNVAGSVGSVLECVLDRKQPRNLAGPFSERLVWPLGACVTCCYMGNMHADNRLQLLYRLCHLVASC